jgi:hypothetical protein
MAAPPAVRFHSFQIIVDSAAVDIEWQGDGPANAITWRWHTVDQAARQLGFEPDGFSIHAPGWDRDMSFMVHRDYRATDAAAFPMYQHTLSVTPLNATIVARPKGAGKGARVAAAEEDRAPEPAAAAMDTLGAATRVEGPTIAELASRPTDEEMEAEFHRLAGDDEDAEQADLDTLMGSGDHDPSE